MRTQEREAKSEWEKATIREKRGTVTTSEERVPREEGYKGANNKDSRLNQYIIFQWVIAVCMVPSQYLTLQDRGEGSPASLDRNKHRKNKFSSVVIGCEDICKQLKYIITLARMLKSGYAWNCG